MSAETVTEEVGFIPALRYVLGAMEGGLAEPSWMYPWEFTWYVDDYDPMGEKRSPFDVKAEMAAIRASLPRPADAAGWKKKYNSSNYILEARFFGIIFTIKAPRTTVCEKVVTGTELREVPDPDYVPPPVPMVTAPVEIVEWVCND